jgi:hypothetical protein
MTEPETTPGLINPKPAAVISSILCLPFLFLMITAAYELESFIPFIDTQSLNDFGSTLLGRIVMLAILFCLPAAFLINLLSMITRADPERRIPFRLTPAHTIIGMSILFGVLIIMSQGVLYELRPFVTPLGPGAPLGQVLFFLALLALPVAFLLNRLSRLAKPTSINLIIGAAILLAILMLASAILLEATACSMGVPNCD